MKSLFIITLVFVANVGFGQTLSDALAKKDTVLALKMLKEGADPNKPDENGTTPLITACRWGNLEMAVFLLNHGAQVDEPRSAKGRTPLMIGCAYYSGMNVCKLLIDKKADINATDKNGVTPLMLAAKDAKLDVVKLLLEKGADISKKDDKGQTALDYVMKAEELEYIAQSVKDSKIDKDKTIALLKSKTK